MVQFGPRLGCQLWWPDFELGTLDLSLCRWQRDSSWTRSCWQGHLPYLRLASSQCCCVHPLTMLGPRINHASSSEMVLRWAWERPPGPLPEH